MIDYLKIFDAIESNFIAAKGRAATSIYKPIEWYKAIITVIDKCVAKRPSNKILIIIENYEEKKTIISALDDLNENLKNNVVIVTSNFYRNFINNFYMSILVDTDINVIDCAKICNKFILYINTNKRIDINTFNSLKGMLPYFDLPISDNELTKSVVNTPVKEWRHECLLSSEDYEKYRKCNEYISDSVKIFGDFKNVEYCRIGNKETGATAFDCCLNISEQNGWSKTLDMSSEYDRQIDSYYNPNAISERASLIYNIARDRTNILLNNKNKFNTILDICNKNINKKILIVSKNGDFANELSSFLTSNNINNGMFHNEVPASYMNDESGNLITYKSGENKGKPKLFKSAAISKYYKQLYDTDYINVLIIKEASDPDLNIKVDLIIFTSTLLNNIFDFKSRYQSITYPTNFTTIHRLYTKDTIEEQRMYKESQSKLIEIQNSVLEENICIDSETGEVNL